MIKGRPSLGRQKTGKRIRNGTQEDINKVAAKEREKPSSPSFRKGGFSQPQASVRTWVQPRLSKSVVLTGIRQDSEHYAPSSLRLQPSGPKPKWLGSQRSQCWPAMPGWHSHWPVRTSHCPLVEPNAWQSHLQMNT